MAEKVCAAMQTIDKHKKNKLDMRVKTLLIDNTN